VSRLACIAVGESAGRLLESSQVVPATKKAPAASAESARAIIRYGIAAGANAPADAPWYDRGMANPYGITLDDYSLRWAAAEKLP
jgi:hypothetical protein